MTEIRDEFDGPWKDIIEAYFEAFVLFFFPHIHAEIDWSRGYNFLDKELSQVVRDAELGHRLADKLVQLWRINGEESWVLMHVEVQNQEEGKFGERLFTYYYRLKDKYNVPIVSLAILGDERSTWRPSTFDQSLWGCGVHFWFPIVKLVDYESRWAELEECQNPFAIVVMAHLKTKETRQDMQKRKEWKFRLTRMLYERDYARQDILNIFRFLDWLLELPEALKQSFRDELAQYEQERQMPYVTSIERMGIEQGREEGREEGRSIILRQLIRRVGPIPPETIAQVNGIPFDRIERLADALLDFTNLDDLNDWLTIDRLR
jgi:hypothetical protein